MRCFLFALLGMHPTGQIEATYAAHSLCRGRMSHRRARISIIGSSSSAPRTRGKERLEPPGGLWEIRPRASSFSLWSLVRRVPIPGPRRRRVCVQLAHFYCSILALDARCLKYLCGRGLWQIGTSSALSEGGLFVLWKLILLLRQRTECICRPILLRALSGFTYVDGKT